MDATVAARYRAFAPWARPTSPLYADWAEGISGDPELTRRIGELPDRERQPNLIFAAARWAGGPLVSYGAWREWMLSHWQSVAEITATRSTQTNEVGRCATILPALADVSGPIALLEAGAAAGLCLFPDRHAYDYTTPSGRYGLTAADADSAATVPLPCDLDDERSRPTRLPEVVWRAGIDLNPIDVRDDDAVAWLETLVWPGSAHDGRVARLRAAATRAAADPPRIVEGDVFDHLSALAAESPADATLVVFHSAVLLYFDATARARFAELVRGLGRAVGRDVRWLSNETSGTLPRIDAQLPAGLDTTGRFVQTLDGTPIALAHQHGATYETRPFMSSARATA